MKEVLMRTVEEAKALISKVPNFKKNLLIYLTNWEQHQSHFFVCFRNFAETSSSQCLCHHGNGEGSTGSAEGRSLHRVPHGTSPSRPFEDGIWQPGRSFKYTGETADPEDNLLSIIPFSRFFSLLHVSPRLRHLSRWSLRMNASCGGLVKSCREAKRFRTILAKMKRQSLC